LILVTGSGLLGSEVVKVLRREPGDVTGTYNSRPKEGMVRLDVTDRDGTIRAIARLRPDVIVHTAAMTNVDYCEDHREEALAANAGGTKNVVDAARAMGSRVVYVSTDYVFDGARGMYREDDAVNPISFYAYTKLLGEYYVKDVPGHVIARTSVVYGNARQNFASWVRDSLRNGTAVRIFTDQYASPTLAVDCAEAIAALIKNGASGTYHAAGGERISRHEFARKIASFYGLDDGLIEPVTTEAMKQKAKRPRDSSLDVSKISTHHKMLNVVEGLRKMEEVR
jgi:dTDP-4-dehydrorhamnose reductase